MVYGLVYSFIFTLSNRVDHVPGILNKHGSPGRSRIYLLYERPITPPARYSLNHLIGDVTSMGFPEPVVHEIGFGNIVMSIGYLLNIIVPIKDELFLVVGSDNSVLDTITLLSVVLSRKKFEYMALHGHIGVHLVSKTIDLLLGRVKIPGGAWRILDFVKRCNGATIKEIMEELGYNEATVRKYLNILKTYNLVKIHRGGHVIPTQIARLF